MVRMSPWERDYPAPGKLNLFLHVVGRRADGYHLLQTAFRLVDRCDRLRYTLRERAGADLVRPLPGIDSSTELSVRAARLLLQESGSTQGVDIGVEKNIPVGGGLGGGSSDAATTLLVLNELLGLRASPSDLARLGLQLGADVPFFLFGRNAFGEGIGELLSALELPPAWYVVLVPPVAVSTRSIFTAPELTRRTKTIKISSFSAGFGSNDLEPVVCRRHAEVAGHLAWLKQFGDARLSGSGACVFAEFGTEHEARSVLARIPGTMRGFAVRGLERHPLMELLDHG
jgi:4-diphosphocytidyl-2-C-methyl-D-erythritol kinase